MKTPAYHVNAFAGTGFAGNPAMVCPLDRWLDDKQLQLIARENQLPVTAFFVEDDDKYALRWFTSTTELQICGHGTLAAAAVIFDHMETSKAAVVFQTKGGAFPVVKDGPLICMDLPVYEAVPCSTRPENLVRALGRAPTEILRAPSNYLAVYEREADIRVIAPDMELLQAVDGLGVIVTAQGEEADFVSRYSRRLASLRMPRPVRRTARWLRIGHGDSGSISSTQSSSHNAGASYGASTVGTASGFPREPCGLLKGRLNMATTHLQLTEVPVAKTGMLIRRPVAEVFEAFVNPDITTKFWFTKGSGRLEAGKQVQWDWEMYDISIPVSVKSIEPNKRILIEWPGAGGPTTVEWLFTSLEDGTTFVRITNSGFTGDGDELVKQATDSTQGFSLVLAGLKALLEHDVRLNLVPDRYPKGIDEH